MSFVQAQTLVIQSPLIPLKVCSWQHTWRQNCVTSLLRAL